jgi:hypothetical protein
VSSAEALCLAREANAAKCKNKDYFSCEATGARMLLACARDLRRLVEASWLRQPEENV